MRRRQHIRVDTFPFLAVLLCAMGSLILLLLVIDRRAKIAAKMKAVEAVRQDYVLKFKRAAVDQQEWERKCKELHDTLVRQDLELKAQLQKILGEKTQTAGRLDQEQARLAELKKAITSQRADLSQQKLYISQRRGVLARASAKEKESQQELTRLARDLDQLERTLEDLLALRRRQQQTYSLVPYRGKRGDNRKPVYVECCPDRLIFYPGAKSVSLGGLAPFVFRGELESAAARSEWTDSKNAKNDSYVLFLVRPNGITSYYAAQEALKGLDVDYGYEFIDGDMVFDFSRGQNVDQTRGPMSLRASAEPPGFVPFPPPGMSSRNSVGGNSGSGNTNTRGRFAGNQPTPGRGLGVPGAGTGPGWNLGAPPGWQASGHSPLGTPAFGMPAQGSAGGSSRIQGTAAGTPDTGVVSVTDNKSGGLAGSLSRGRGSTGTGSAGPSDVSVRNSQSSSPGAWRPGSTQAMAGSPTSADEPWSLAPGKGSAGSNARIGIPGASAPGSESSALPTNSGGASQSGAAGKRTPGASGPGTDGSTMTSTAMVAQNASSGPRAPGTSASPGSPVGNPPGANAAPIGGAGSSPASGDSDGGSAPTMATPLSNMEKPIRRRPTVTTITRRFGDRDFIVVLECRADAVVVQPWGNRFPLTSLPEGISDAAADDVPLVRSVRQRIAQRQASVRPGEPPYRPMIRFQVQPDGLRAYYQAYPLIAPLGFPMQRENLTSSP